MLQSTRAPVALMSARIASTSGVRPKTILGRTNLTCGYLYRSREAIAARFKAEATCNNSILSSFLSEEGELPDCTSVDLQPSSVPSLFGSAGSEHSSQPAFASSNNSLLSVMVETFTHSSPSFATMSTRTLLCFAFRFLLPPIHLSRRSLLDLGVSKENRLLNAKSPVHDFAVFQMAT